MSVTVRIPMPLRSITRDDAEVQATGDTVLDLVADLDRQFPGLRERLVDASGELRRFVNIYLNEEDIRFLHGKSTPLRNGDTVSIIPAIAGGGGTDYGATTFHKHFLNRYIVSGERSIAGRFRPEGL